MLWNLDLREPYFEAESDVVFEDNCVLSKDSTSGIRKNWSTKSTNPNMINKWNSHWNTNSLIHCTYLKRMKYSLIGIVRSKLNVTQCIDINDTNLVLSCDALTRPRLNLLSLTVFFRIWNLDRDFKCRFHIRGFVSLSLKTFLTPTGAGGVLILDLCLSVCLSTLCIHASLRGNEINLNHTEIKTNYSEF